MTNAETNTAAVLAERGAAVAPEKARPKKVATQKKGAPQGQKTAKGGKAHAAKKKAKPGNKEVSQSARAKPTGAPRAAWRVAAMLPSRKLVPSA